MGEGEGLFVFGLGYSASALARRLVARGRRVGGTVRDPEKGGDLRAAGIEIVEFDGLGPSAAVANALSWAGHILVSIPPGEAGDVALACHGQDIRAMPGLKRILYLSTTAVYGDWGGAWIDETAPPRALSARGGARLRAEGAWAALAAERGVALDIFRLAGIYGPGRSVIDQIRAGTAKRVVKPGQVFSRIHREDIAGALEAAIDRRLPGGVYNLADDEPAPPQEVVEFACALLNVPPPPLVPFETAELSAMARSFYSDNKRVSNRRVKEALGLALRYPTYREGLRSLVDAV